MSVDYLRISVTDRCNLRCIYCNPLGDCGFLEHKDILRFDEIERIARLFTECGINIVLSAKSTMELAEKGYGTVMSENICFPAKIANGHIMDLIEKKVDRIFYPMVRYNRSELDSANNDYNCPIVTGYPEIIKSSINPSGKHNIPFDNPPITLQIDEMTAITCWEYLGSLGVKKERFEKIDSFYYQSKK